MGFLIQIAFRILLSGCLLAWSLPISDLGIPDLQKDVECLSDSMFYAPSNVPEACITTALDCMMRELNGTVVVECDDPNKRLTDAAEFLDLLIEEWKKKGHAQADYSECSCEGWPLDSYSGFLKHMETLVQMTYSLRY